MGFVQFVPDRTRGACGRGGNFTMSPIFLLGVFFFLCLSSSQSPIPFCFPVVSAARVTIPRREKESRISLDFSDPNPSTSWHVETHHVDNLALAFQSDFLLHARRAATQTQSGSITSSGTLSDSQSLSASITESGTEPVSDSAVSAFISNPDKIRPSVSDYNYSEPGSYLRH